MVDITHKSNTKRTAIAQAMVHCGSLETIKIIEQGKVPKGDVLSFARAAALLAIKNTSAVVPDCHPLPIEFSELTFSLEAKSVRIKVEVSTIYKTGVEVEAMHGAMIAALTLYDMLKPIDKELVIGDVQLLEKTGGKSSWKSSTDNIKCRVVVCSDSISSGKGTDKAGGAIQEKLEALAITSELKIISDDSTQIQDEFQSALTSSMDLLIYCGGTGLSEKDITPDSIEPLLDRTIPGIMEVARSYGQDRMPYSMLSRSLAGMKDGMLVLCLPGSLKGAQESMDALFPHVLHVLKMYAGGKHN